MEVQIIGWKALALEPWHRMLLSCTRIWPVITLISHEMQQQKQERRTIGMLYRWLIATIYAIRGYH